MDINLHGFLHGMIQWIMFHRHLDYFQKPPLGGRPNTKPGDHGTLKSHDRWLIILYHVWGPHIIEIGFGWDTWSRMTSHYTWEPVITLLDSRSALRRPLDIFFWTLTISWSQLLAQLPVPGKRLGIIGQEPSDSKSNRLHGDIFQFCCFHSFEVCSIDSSKMIDKFPEVLNFSKVISWTQTVHLQLTASSFWA